MLTRRGIGSGKKALLSTLVLMSALACCKKRAKGEQPASSMSELYGLKKVPNFELTLSEADITSLHDAPKKWRRGRFIYAGKSFDGVRIRLKGHRSLRTLDEKPSIKLRFDKGKKFKKRRFLGLKRLTLNNLVEDPTMIREYLAYRLARELDLPVPKAGYATLSINGESYGLYLVVETPDEDFLERRFGSKKGELYEGEYGCDLYEDDVMGYDQDVGDAERRGLRAFAKTVARGGAAAWSGSNAPMTLSHLSTFLAFSSYVGDFDGYQHSHNYRIYRNPADNKWQFMSWGLDRSFYKSIEPYSSRGLLAKRCFADSSCRRAYLMALRRVHKAAQKVDLGMGARVISSIIADAVNTDQRRPHDAEKITKERKRLLDFLESRASYVADVTRCLEPQGQEIDRDGDGYGCMDCDDTNAQVHPGAKEICDQIDNNCSGLIDDSPACPCIALPFNDIAIELCQLPMPWLEAEAFCQAKGGQLLSVSSVAAAKDLRELADAYDKNRWWVGGNDQEREGEWRWSNNTKIAEAFWAKGEPDNSGCNQDCAVLHTTGKLHDTHCGQHHPFICEVPATAP